MLSAWPYVVHQSAENENSAVRPETKTSKRN
jgi:hypothetical protein